MHATERAIAAVLLARNPHDASSRSFGFNPAGCTYFCDSIVVDDVQQTRRYFSHSRGTKTAHEQRDLVRERRTYECESARLEKGESDGQ